MTVNGEILSALLDSDSTHSYISERVVLEIKVNIHPSNKFISMTQKTLITSFQRYADPTQRHNSQSYVAA